MAKIIEGAGRKLKRSSDDLEYARETKRPRTTAGREGRNSQDHEFAILSTSPEAPWDEAVLVYESSIDPEPTALTVALSASNTHGLQEYLQRAQHVSLSLGSFCADLFWHDLLDDKSANQTLQSLLSQEMTRHIRTHQKMPLPDWEASCGTVISAKLRKLLEFLSSHKPQASTFKAVIIVERQCQVSPLVSILSMLGGKLDFLRTHAISDVEDTLDSSDYVQCLKDFDSDAFNLVVIPRSVEDLRFYPVPLVINFDLPDNLLSYAYSCLQTCLAGRLIHMTEHGNNKHRARISRFRSLDQEGFHWIARSRISTEAFPPTAVCADLLSAPRNHAEDRHTRITEPATGCYITRHDSVSAIYRYSLGLGPPDGHHTDDHPPMFEYKEVKGDGDNPQFICTVILPGSPAARCTSSPMYTRELGRRMACLQACSHLFESGKLDLSCFPPHPIVVQVSNPPGLASSLQPKGDNKTHYPQKVPLLWSNLPAAEQANAFYPLILHARQNRSDLPHAPLLVLFTLPPPVHICTTINLFGTDAPSSIELIPAAPFSLDQEQISLLHGFTLRAYRTLMNKPVSYPASGLQYLLAPLQSGLSISRAASQQVEAFISWSRAKIAAETWAVPLHTDGSNLEEEILDAILSDTTSEFTRRYHDLKLRPDLSPKSKPPDSEMSGGYESYMAYCASHRKDWNGLKDEDQPLVQVRKLPVYPNNLDPLSTPFDSSTRCFIPELCTRLTIPASTLRMVYLLPAVMHRLEELLLVKELNNNIFSRSISEDLLLEAITAPSCCANYDYERLEWLGDSFLKYLSSCYFFSANPAYNEGQLHGARREFISNKSFHIAANRVHLPQYIRSKPFNLKLWSPAMISHDTSRGNSESTLNTEVSQAMLPTGSKHSKSRRKQARNVQVLGDKVLANVLEATVAAAFLSGGREAGLTAAKALSLPLRNIYQWSDMAQNIDRPTVHHISFGTVRALEDLTGLNFEDIDWISQAMTHISFHMDKKLSYERLEYLGDAILDFVTVCYLYDRYPNVGPGGLSMLKSAMVCNPALAAISVHYGFHDLILFGDHRAVSHIMEYATQLKTLREGEHHLAKRENRPPAQYWVGIEPPKLVSDVMESLIAAIYLSDSCELSGVQVFFDKVLRPFYDEYITLQTLAQHPTTVLMQLLQTYPCHELEMEAKRVEGGYQCDVIVHGVVLTRGEGKSAPVAARVASASALDALEGDKSFLSAICSCKSNTTGSKNKKKQGQGEGLSIVGGEDEAAKSILEELAAKS